MISKIKKMKAQAMNVESNVRMYWALDANGIIKNVNEVPNGKLCKCICIKCKRPLISKNECIKVSNHFSHYGKPASDCTGESALHYVAKYILKEELESGRKLPLPNNSKVTKKQVIKNGFDKCLFEPHEIQVEFILENGMITDLLILGEHGKSLAVEIFVTHKKSKNDIHKFKAIRQNVIEIDLSKLSWDSSRQEIADAIFSQQNINWLYPKDEEKSDGYFLMLVDSFSLGESRKSDKFSYYSDDENLQESIDADLKKIQDLIPQALCDIKLKNKKAEEARRKNRPRFGDKFNTEVHAFIDNLELPVNLGKAVSNINFQDIYISLFSINNLGRYSKRGYEINCTFMSNSEVEGKMLFLPKLVQIPDKYGPLVIFYKNEPKDDNFQGPWFKNF